MRTAQTKKVFSVEFMETGRIGIIRQGSTIMEAARQADVPLYSVCGGNGVCGKCQVYVEEGRVHMKPNPFIEKDGEIGAGYVLACLSEVLSDLRVRVPDSSIGGRPHVGEEQARDHGPGGKYGITYPHNPLYRRIYLELPVPSLSDHVSDLERVKCKFKRAAGSRQVRINLDCIRSLPDILRKTGFKITVTFAFRDDIYEVVRFESGNTVGRNYGIAVDIGTTTVTANLVDLNEGSVCESFAIYNAQIQYGEDIINRIVYAQENGAGLTKLNELIVNDINTLVKTLVTKSGIHRRDVNYMVCTGNTTMIHLLLGIPPGSIRKEPYIPVTGYPPTILAKEIGIEINEKGYLGFLPGCGAYVGSDITAAVLASGMAHEKKTCLLIDVGTNGEIVVGDEDWFICCSASAGPAFEGAGTMCGVRATSGAIERVRIEENGHVEIKIIGGENSKAIGICGSGYIDLVAELFTAGFLDRTGRFRTDVNSLRVRNGENGPEFLLIDRENSATGRDIIITEDDIVTLIRTKGAIYTAAEVILKHVGLAWSSIDKIFISGRFGSFLDVERSIAIGLLPDLDRNKFRFIGNGSIAGARMCLLSEHALMAAEEIAHKMTYFDLSTDIWFMKEYTSSLFLPHTDMGKFPTVTVSAVR